MKTNCFEDFENAQNSTRVEFNKTTQNLRYLIEEPFNLYCDLINLIRNITKDGDDETYGIEILTTVIRRVLASFILLESGLDQEAHMILRNALDLILIAIDILYNPNSLIEWKKTYSENLKDSKDKNWYFTPRKIIDRLEIDNNNQYPEIAKELAENIYDEWIQISNISLHAHSYAQITSLTIKKGQFQLLGLKSPTNYENDFSQYGIFFLNIVSIITNLQKYSSYFKKFSSDNIQIRKFVSDYARLLYKFTSKGIVIIKVNSREDLLSLIKQTGYPFDITSIQNNIEIEFVTFDFRNPDRPKMSIQYKET